MPQRTRRTTIDRRTFLAGGAAAGALALAGCTAPAPAPTTSPSATATATGPDDWTSLASAVRGTLLRPTSSGYATARLTENPRFDDAKPLGVLEAASAADVAAGLAFARNTRTPLAVRSGGHNYAGWSAGGASGTDVKPSLVISTAGLDDVRISGEGTLTVGPGASMAKVYAALGEAGRAIGAGSCATVAIGGLTLGGGVGVLARSFGLTCDQLTGVEIVTADGAVHHCTATSDADLFWASRGGGGGVTGVVTSMTFDTQAAPQVTMFALTWPWSAAAQVVAAWQDWALAEGAPDQLWSTLKLLGGQTHPSGPALTVSGTWTGDSAALAAQLAPLLKAVKTAPTSNVATSHTYQDAMFRYAGCADQPASKCTTAPGGVLDRVAESGTSHLPTTTLPAAGIAALVAKVEAAQSVVGLTEGGISLDALGGAVSRVGAADTAFAHRSALMSVQYTATFADGASPAAYDSYVRGFRTAMGQYWSDTAYVNYADPSLSDPGQAYFGDNLAGLKSIAKKVDPDGIFAQPHLLD
ncbi:FAD-dependent oxidoreductase [Frondihabitans australicus]|uniref:Berberine-like enzyme n=1 Tax=Frondihabitans australicus TaxID=386892 RepID=A0A495ICU8_9MICO|nr:FAD-dependent oxidoreductase [Frondihabitans australicus]RKR73749.1 berberine-like enzyme [Frondihabitans australicus]